MMKQMNTHSGRIAHSDDGENDAIAVVENPDFMPTQREGDGLQSTTNPTRMASFSLAPRPGIRERSAQITAQAMQIGRNLRWNSISWSHCRVYALFGATTSITLGHVILLSPLVLFTTACLYTTFMDLSTSLSGLWAYYALIYVFVLSFKKATLFQWLVGLSWEQLVPIHHAAAIVAVLLAACHGYVAYTGHDYSPCRDPLLSDAYVANNTIFQELPICQTVGEKHDTNSANSTMHRNLGAYRLLDNPRFRYSMIGPEPSLWTFLWDGSRNSSGTWMFVWMLVAVGTSMFRGILRKPCFELWLVLHISAAGAVIAYSDKHRVQLFTFVLVWWALDGFVRYGYGTLFRLPKTATLSLVITSSSLSTLQEQRKNQHQAEITATSDDDNDYDPTNDDGALVELLFRHKFVYTAGQYVRIAIVETGQPVMFHPLTISSAPYQDEVTVHVRPFGRWTRQVARMAPHRPIVPNHYDTNGSSVSSSRIQSSSSRRNLKLGSGRTVRVLLEGPYGGIPLNLWNDQDACYYPTVVLIAGGIGITPMTSIARQLLHNSALSPKTSRQRIRVVWAVRDLGLAEALPLVPTEEEKEAAQSAEFFERSSSSKRFVRNDRMIDPEGGIEVVATASSSTPSTIVSNPPLFEADIYITAKTKKNRTTTKRSTISPSNRSTPVVTEASNHEDGFELDNPSQLFQYQQPILETVMNCSNSSSGCEDPVPIPAPVRPESSRDERGYVFYTGRPNVYKILQEMVIDDNNDDTLMSRIAVIACGPPDLVQSANDACTRLNCVYRNVSLDFHEEVFLY
jgi:predicted ferric reductase